MTLPSSGPLSFLDIQTEVTSGAVANTVYSSSLNWINENSKGLFTPGGSTAMNVLYGTAFFKNTTQGNCNNGNCSGFANCGNINCRNCEVTGTINCVNCDDKSYFQNNCNCVAAYNCNANQTSYNCNCDCACDCACDCTPPPPPPDCAPPPPPPDCACDCACDCFVCACACW